MGGAVSFVLRDASCLCVDWAACDAKMPLAAWKATPRDWSSWLASQLSSLNASTSPSALVNSSWCTRSLAGDEISSRSKGSPVAELRCSGAAADTERVALEKGMSKNSSREPAEEGNCLFVSNEEGNFGDGVCDRPDKPPVGGAAGNPNDSTSDSTGTLSLGGEEEEEGSIWGEADRPRGQTRPATKEWRQG